MSWQAKGLYRELLDEYWAEGSLSLDHGELADICGCSLDEFEMYWPEIKGCWEESEESLANATMDSMRTETDSKRVTNAKNGKAGAIAKLANAKQTPSKRQSVASERHIEEKRREEKSKEEQVPSRGKRESDSRHVPFRNEIEAYALAKKVQFVWDESEAKQLSLLLKACPMLQFDDFKQCLIHRARSPGIPHGERPRVWLPNILKYQEAPLNEFGKTGVGNGNRNSKTGGNVDAARGAFAILAEAERNSNLADEVQPETGGGGEPGDLSHLRAGSLEL